MRLVVGVGASAGGLDAFKQLVSVLPRGSGMAFLFVQHLDPSHESMLAELLAPHTELSVRGADHGVELRADTIYVVRPDTALAVRGPSVELSPPVPLDVRGVRATVDHLFRSLAREYGPRAAGIVLSGAGSGGSAGLEAIKAAGGLTVAQNPDSCGQPGMPNGAIDAGVVDEVLEIGQMPAALERFAGLASRADVDAVAGARGELHPERLSSLTEAEMSELARLLHVQSGFDLRVYKPATIERRVLRRMRLSGFEELDGYLERLRQAPAERQRLMRDLLISVTDFFRDPEAFRALREITIDPLVSRARPGTVLRAWIPGCATGEEAYSIAMEFLDAIDVQDKRVGLQVFATDVDQHALAFGRAAIYPPSIAEHVPEQRLATYFKRLDGEGYRVRPVLRDAVSFAVHDLTKDPPFSRMNLVTCRNVLIYLTPEAQKHVLKIMHFALESDGYLFLSTSESPGLQKDLFATASKTQHIYTKVGSSRPITLSPSRGRGPQDPQEIAPSPAGAASQPGHTARPSGHDLARRIVLSAWVPPTVVVSAEGAVLFVHGELGPFLRFPQGEDPRLELGSLLRPEIATRTRAALYKCRMTGETVVAVSSPDGRRSGRVRITAKPATGLGDDAVMLSFEGVEEAPAAADRPSERPESSAQEDVIEQLERELQATREDLRNTVEELETSNEELRSSNEESVSMNEELQSTNEELEATTEELRSLNEELSTLNAQLRDKVEQLEHAHDDLHNFFSSTKIATLFLDERLRIKRFTPAAHELFGIDHSDIGRCVVDIARELLHDDLEREARLVIEHLSTHVRELRTSDGRWFARQVLPYRTQGQHIEGVVVTYVEITALKSVAEQLAMRGRQQSVIARTGLRALRDADLQGFMEHVVRDVQQTLDTDYCKILELQPGGKRLYLRAGVGWNPGIVGSAYVATGPDSQAGYTLQSPEPVIVDDLATEKRFSGPALLCDHGVTSGVSCVIRDGDHQYGVLGAHTRGPRKFSREDADFLQAVGIIVGSAVGRYQTRLRLALELGVAHVLAEASDLDEALGRVLECMASELHASIGEVWWPQNDAAGLSRRRLHVSARRDTARVERLLDHTFEPGEGLVGQVFLEAQAVWCTDLGDPELFARREGAKELGLASGFGLPIRAGSEVLGVVTLLSCERLLADEVFLRSLEGIGRSIGEFARRAQAEARTRGSEARKAAMLHASLDGIVTMDRQGRIVEFNAAAQQMFGYAESEALSRDMAELIIPARLREAHRLGLARAVAGAEGRVIGRRIEMPAVRRDGTEFSVDLAITRIWDAGEPMFTGFIRDITERKRAEDALREADRQKDEFLAMLGHELRNPLAAIRTASELLELKSPGDQRFARTQAVLERQTTHMAKLLDGLLDVSRIVRGKIKLETELVDFAAVCREVLSDAAERMSGRELDLRIAIPPEPIWVEADRVRLSQIIDNLLSNAFKYTNDGGAVTLALSCDAETAALEVRDTGIGIEPDLLPYVFDVFRQSKQTIDRSQGGLGLGLSLVKSLAELQGGSVEAASDGKNRGSAFVVRIPIAQKQRAPVGLGAAREFDGSFDLLVIEDNEDAAEMLQQVLELCGHRVALAARGQQGVAMAKERVPDVILCDLGLPDGMSGFDVARALRADPEMQGVVLVALSGYGRPEDKERGVEAGFDAHITKPVDIKMLERVLSELVARSRAARR